MAKVITHKCNACGAPLSVSGRGGKYTCPHCGMINLFEAEESSADSFICPQCGTANPKEALHCNECGMKFTLTCPKCGAVNAADSLFCLKCGVNFQSEFAQRESAQARALLQLQQAQVKSSKRKKVVGVFAAVLGLLFLLCVALGMYALKFSPEARATATAEALTRQQATQTFFEALKAQYPFHGINGAYAVYLKNFCVERDQNSGRNFAWIRLRYFQEDPSYDFDWDFKRTYLTDDRGNRFEVTQEMFYGNDGKNMVTDFDPASSSLVLHVISDAWALPEIQISFTPNDPILTATCADE